MESLLAHPYVLLGIFACVLAVLAVQLYGTRARFLASPYHEQTGRSFFEVYQDRGAWFEYLVGCDVLQLFEGSHVLWNVYLPHGRGGTSECDIVVILNGRLVVIECKAYSGWIYGRESDRRWTQTFNSNSKYRFYNPIRQNASHVRALSRYLGIDAADIVSLVVFSNECELKRVEVTGDIPVCKHWELPQRLHSALQVDAAPIECEDVYDKLYPLTQVDDAVKLSHIERIQQRYRR